MVKKLIFMGQTGHDAMRQWPALHLPASEYQDYTKRCMGSGVEKPIVKRPALQTPAGDNGPSQSDAERCLREAFNKMDPAMFRHAGDALCPAFMTIESVDLLDTSMTTPSLAQAKVHVNYLLIQPIGGQSLIAEDCAHGHYGAEGQNFSAGARLNATFTVRMQKWSSGWQCSG